jgi:hypothetical protein
MGIDVYGGAMLAEMCLMPKVIEFGRKNKTAFRQILPFIMASLAIICFSYPNKKVDEYGWASFLHAAGEYAFPIKAAIYKTWHTIGAFLLVSSIILSPLLQTLFSHPILVWLGQISFPIYLIHGPLIRSLLKWIFYLTTTQIDVRNSKGNIVRQTPKPTWWQFLYAIPIFTFVLLYLAQLWYNKVEPCCAMVTKEIEDLVLSKGDKHQTLPINTT